MICYRDMTFCPFWKDCLGGSSCHRALTDETIEKAKKWIGHDSPPICQYSEKPSCWRKK